jgi:hypothetical protein
LSKQQPPPIYSPVVDETGVAELPWVLYFNQIFTGDTGTDWTPTFTSLTTVGTPTIKGSYYKIIQGIAYFRVDIVPATSTSSTAGTTFINNFPLVFKNNGVCFALSGLLGSNAGQCLAGTKQIYVPSWSAVTVPLTIVGMCEVQ